MQKSILFAVAALVLAAAGFYSLSVMTIEPHTSSIEKIIPNEKILK